MEKTFLFLNNIYAANLIGNFDKTEGSQIKDSCFKARRRGLGVKTEGLWVRTPAPDTGWCKGLQAITMEK